MNETLRLTRQIELSEGRHLHDTGWQGADGEVLTVETLDTGAVEDVFWQVLEGRKERDRDRERVRDRDQ